MNRLLFGDNLQWLQDRAVFPDNSVGLIYLDPPFNSNVDYNVLFREASGESSRAQFHAFTDTWSWVDAEDTYREFINKCSVPDVLNTMESFRSFLKMSPMMAYLAMMAPRLVELQRVLKPTGSLYLHCDPTASHYLKMLLDAVFGPTNFLNEIIWKRGHAHSSAKRFGPNHDVLLFYAKSAAYAWHPVHQPYDPAYVVRHYRHVAEDGRRYKHENPTGAGIRRGLTGQPWRGIDPTPKGRHWVRPPAELDKLDAQGRVHWPSKPGAWPYIKEYLDDPKRKMGMPAQDVWTDIDPINMMAMERLGYPTQKPETLLERIIQASSAEGDTVLDPFCGCGTTIAVAQRLKRNWIGIDITYLAINLIKRRLASAFGKIAYMEMGQPTDIMGARHLAELDRFQFQQWALSLIDAMPLKSGEGKGADRGVDGLLYFYESKDVRRRLLVQVKSGSVKRGDVATLLGDVGNQKAAAGILITLDPPTTAMRKEAVAAGRYTSSLWRKKDYPMIQILTVEALLNGTDRPDTPPLDDPFTKAPKARAAEQIEIA